MAGSSELQEQLTEFQAIAGLLPLAAEDAPVPSRLKARIMAAAWQDVVAAQEPRRSRRSWREAAWSAVASRPVLGASAAAAAMLVALLTAWVVQLTVTNEELRGELQIALVTGTEAAPDAGGEVVTLRDEGFSVLRAWSLPPSGPERVYQVWLIADGVPTSAGILTAGPRTGELIAAVPWDLSAFDALAVSLERAPGVPQRAGPIVLLAEL